MEKTVYFRTFEPEDAEYIYRWHNDDKLLEMTVGLNRRISKKEADDWVNNRMMHNPYQYYWAICSIENDRIIGYTYLSNIHFINSSACLGGIIIGDRNYQDGFAWIETYLFIFDFAFHRLGLNRLYGESIIGHPQSNSAEDIFLFTKEGKMRQSVFKNGKFYDTSFISLLKEEYDEYLSKGEYEFSKILRRVRLLKIK